MASNGHQPPRAPTTVPTWNPATLLQPNRRNASSPALSQINPHAGSNRIVPRDGINSLGNDPMVFQFSSPAPPSSAGPSSNASTPPPSFDGNPMNGASSIGVGNWVERMNHLQDRSMVPQPKRRKTVDGEFEFTRDGSMQPVRSGSGMLGEYVKEKRKEANGASRAMTVDLTDGGDDDVITISDPRDEEVCYGLVKTGLNCTRVPSPKPGAPNMWGPNYMPAIKIVLKRTVGDQTLKIEGYDHTRETIGLVDPNGAAALTPLLDTNIRLRTDCRIPPSPRKQGEVSGQITSRSYGLDVVMYGPIRYAKNVGIHLARHNMRLLSPQIVQKGIRVQNPHVTEFRPPPPKSYPTDSSGSFAVPTVRTLEEVRSEVMGVFDSLTRSEDLPAMDPPSCILTPLLKHQQQGLFFMTMREQPREVQAKEKAMRSFWQTKAGPQGQQLFHNVITGHSHKKPPPETRGGVLADMMGLGKTLSILSLITSTLEVAGEYAKLVPEQQPVLEQDERRGNGLPSQPSLEMTTLKLNAKTTLLVCPLSTVSNWEEQIKQHIAPDHLSYHIYHGPNRIKDPVRLATFDLVITTYGSVSNELSSRRKGKDGLFPLEEISWFRIALDEAHMIREHSTLQFKAICRLHAQRRWAVTGTPVQNRLDDLGALLAFLRLHPFHDRGKFHRYIVEPFKVCDPEIVPKMRVLVDTVTLRRLKDRINLPPREDVIAKLDFSPEEREIYDMFARNAQDRVKVLAGSNNSRALGGNTYIHILKTILRLRLLCAHGKDLLNEDDLASLQGMSREMAIDIDDDDDDSSKTLSHQKAHDMLALMQETNGDACVDCSRRLSSTNDSSNVESESQEDVLGYMTPCFHVVCRQCISGYQERARSLLQPGAMSGPCAECGDHVRFEFVELRKRDVDAEHDGQAPSTRSARNGAKAKNFDKYEGPHTKTRALLEDLVKSKSLSEANPSEPPYKSVVFSGWTSHLDLIELALNAASIQFVRLDGSMSRNARTAAMDRFRDDPEVHVILVSIMAGGLGLNLTAGNNVYVMEPQYNPAAEAQAVDRVHRLGQKRPVRTVRYIMRNSFEEKMLELQEKKMKLASLSMDGQNRKLDKAEAARQKLMDLRSLFK